MHRAWALLVCAALAGCGLSTEIIKAAALFFNDAVEDATNKLLVLNVLRAREEILAVMHQLIGLHRSAADLRQTPTVQVLP